MDVCEKASALSERPCGDIVKGVCNVEAEHFIDQNSLVACVYKLWVIRNDADELYTGVVDDGNDFILGFLYRSAVKFVDDKAASPDTSQPKEFRRPFRCPNGGARRLYNNISGVGNASCEL